jgi:hypothetical protein
MPRGFRAFLFREDPYPTTPKRDRIDALMGFAAPLQSTTRTPSGRLPDPCPPALSVSPPKR